MIVITNNEGLKQTARTLNEKLKSLPYMTMDEVFDMFAGDNKHGIQSKDDRRWVAYIDNLVMNCLPECRLRSERLIRPATLELIPVKKIDENGLLKMVNMMLFKDDLESIRDYADIFNIANPRRSKTRMTLDKVVDLLYRKKRPYRRKKPYIGPPDRSYRCRLPVDTIQLLDKHQEHGYQSPSHMIEAGLKMVSVNL